MEEEGKETSSERTHRTAEIPRRKGRTAAGAQGPGGWFLEVEFKDKLFAVQSLPIFDSLRGTVDRVHRTLCGRVCGKAGCPAGFAGIADGCGSVGRHFVDGFSASGSGTRTNFAGGYEIHAAEFVRLSVVAQLADARDLGRVAGWNLLAHQEGRRRSVGCRSVCGEPLGSRLGDASAGYAPVSRRAKFRMGIVEFGAGNDGGRDRDVCSRRVCLYAGNTGEELGREIPCVDVCGGVAAVICGGPIQSAAREYERGCTDRRGRDVDYHCLGLVV